MKAILLIYAEKRVFKENGRGHIDPKDKADILTRKCESPFQPLQAHYFCPWIIKETKSYEDLSCC